MKPLINFFKKYFSKLFFPVLWTAIIIILLSLPGTMLPNESHFNIPQFDKIVHIGLFGGFVFLWGVYINSKKFPLQKTLILFFYIFCIGSALGIIMEYVQKYFIPMRDFDLGDIIADIIGASIAYGISNIFLAVENDAQSS
ncbi:MAG: VanZ family protein [Bacteroidetes bacterium]|nr:VanZ family protein [Bacteroidota bacterium]